MLRSNRGTRNACSVHKTPTHRRPENEHPLCSRSKYIIGSFTEILFRRFCFHIVKRILIRMQLRTSNPERRQVIPVKRTQPIVLLFHEGHNWFWYGLVSWSSWFIWIAHFLKISYSQMIYSRRVIKHISYSLYSLLSRPREPGMFF